MGNRQELYLPTPHEIVNAYPRIVTFNIPSAWFGIKDISEYIRRNFVGSFSLPFNRSTVKNIQMQMPEFKELCARMEGVLQEAYTEIGRS